ncbi:hypothetical protein Tsubulata_048132 [Turnera subulata]|uniref:Uncharacterized protein n=1 Tax=Turnera subulata TaxID=218843 RepID=A0A9Q0JQN1_9ROSI|nr:hypothetical protein Tsubulata_048132 [Turnera subulata]
MATVTLQESVLESQSLHEKQKVDDVAVASAEDEFDKCMSDCDSDCRFVFETPEQRRAIHRYLREMKDTKGFGLSLCTQRLPCFGLASPFYEPDEDEDKPGLKLKRIPYAALQGCAGFIYYIVFEAEDPDFPGEIKVYQTKVYDGIGGVNEVMEFQPRTK